VSELARTNVTKIYVDGITGNTDFKNNQKNELKVYSAAAGANSITTNYAVIASESVLAVEDVIRIGSKKGQDYTITKIDREFIWVSPTLEHSFEFGTVLYKVNAYTLWDADKDRACMCDDHFSGDDCSQRMCPRGDDPLTTDTVLTDRLAAWQKIWGNTDYTQKNEKQNVYLETARGVLSGTFTLTFTDPFGQGWTTEAIYVNERLSSKAYVGATATTVTFSPSLPYGELEAGDYLLIGDERQEVLTTYPIVSTTLHRPQKLGGVVDSVTVRNTFSAASTAVYCFRAGPAKGIKAALEALPNMVVPSVSTEAFNTGQLIGYHTRGITTASGMTTIKNILGDHDRQGHSSAGEAGPKRAFSSTNGGLAPYDTIRIVASGGKSEFLQLRNVDIFPTGQMTVLLAKGKATEDLGNELDFHRGHGIGNGKTGAIYRAGGHHVRVTFNSNSGDLPEMETDTSGLFSVFLREFTGTVAEGTPRMVSCRLHGGAQFNAKAGDAGDIFPIPKAFTAQSSAEHGAGDGTPFKGNLYNLKVMAGMKIKLADQVRTVVQDMSGATATAVASFYVDEPFVINSASEMVANVQYLFYRYPVEQLYDEASYNSLTMSRALHFPDSIVEGTRGNSVVNRRTPWSAAYAQTATISIATASGAVQTASSPLKVTYPDPTGASSILSYMYTGTDVASITDPLICTTSAACKGEGSAAHEGSTNIAGPGLYFPVTSRVSLSECVATDATKLHFESAVVGFVAADALETSISDSQATRTASNLKAASDGLGCVLRSYETMTKLADITAVTGGDASAPPLHINYRTNWATVTDQRPLKWNSPTRDLALYSKILPSPSNIALRAVMAGGASSMRFFVDGTVITFTYTSATALTLGGTAFPAPSDYFYTRNGFTATPITQIGYITISGCDANPGMNREFTMTAVSATAFTTTIPTMVGAVSATNPYQEAFAAKCLNNWVTITSRAGTLIDSKAIAIGDRVKYLSNSITATSNTEQKTYETRTVDKIWGTGQEVTLFTVKDGYSTGEDQSLQDSLAWVDESGSTEDSECSARGLCDGESGVCECFSGYTGQSCELQNALNQ
jgi:hypothetical protein